MYTFMFVVKLSQWPLGVHEQRMENENLVCLYTEHKSTLGRKGILTVMPPC